MQKSFPKLGVYFFSKHIGKKRQLKDVEAVIKSVQKKVDLKISEKNPSKMPVEECIILVSL